MIVYLYILPENPDGEGSSPGSTLEKVSRKVTVFLANQTPGVERSNLRGWFVDLSGCERLLRNDFAGWGIQIAGLLRSHFGVAVQIGIASNKVTAELACRLAKPESVFWLFPGEDRNLMSSVLLSKLPCLIDVQRQVLHDRRLQWAWEAQALGEDTLRLWLGNKKGSEVWQVIHGVCDDPIKPWRVPITIRRTYVFSDATTDRDDLLRAGVYLAGVLYHECALLGGTMRRFACRVIYVDGLTTEREAHLTRTGTLSESDCAATVGRLFQHLPLRRVQLESVTLQCPIEFEATEQQDLFSERERLKRRDLDQALKVVREKYGAEALYRASGAGRRGRSSGRRP